MKVAIAIFVTLILVNTLYSQWEPEINISNSPDTTSFTSPNNSWCIASSGSFVHAVWWESLGLAGDIWYRRSINNGVNWETKIQLTSGQRSETPAIAVSGPYVHCVWRDDRNERNEIYYRRSTDNGATWDEDARPLKFNTEDENSESPSIAVSGSYVHVVWAHTRTAEEDTYAIYYIRSTDN
ncbi:MAG: sialidase family protein [candidate division WOR-3 bacterium]